MHIEWHDAMKKPGFDKNTSLAERMKSYEAVNDYSLIPRIPVYVRLDGRAFHTFCRTLKKPFDDDFFKTMKRVTAYLHDETNALLSYCQSDEISLVYEMPEKMPFGTRLFKVQSVLAGMCSAAFVTFGLDGTREDFSERVKKLVPHFDCRVCQMSLEETANMVMWREQDSIKNSITLLALSCFSNKDIHKKNGVDKIKMLKDVKGIDYYEVLPEELRNGAYFRREHYDKVLLDEEISKIPSKQLAYMKKNADGKLYVTRSRVVQFCIGMPLSDVANKVEVLYRNATPVKMQHMHANMQKTKVSINEMMC